MTRQQLDELKRPSGGKPWHIRVWRCDNKDESWHPRRHVGFIEKYTVEVGRSGFWDQTDGVLLYYFVQFEHSNGALRMGDGRKIRTSNFRVNLNCTALRWNFGFVREISWFWTRDGLRNQLGRAPRDAWTTVVFRTRTGPVWRVTFDLNEVVQYQLNNWGLCLACRSYKCDTPCHNPSYGAHTERSWWMWKLRWRSRGRIP